jgi:hypothetical protein
MEPRPQRMNASQFRAELTRLLGEPDDYSTINAWGFGGIVGKLWKKDHVSVKMGKAYFRHLSPENVLLVYVDDRQIASCDHSPRFFPSVLAVISRNP